MSEELKNAFKKAFRMTLSDRIEAKVATKYFGLPLIIWIVLGASAFAAGSSIYNTVISPQITIEKPAIIDSNITGSPTTFYGGDVRVFNWNTTVNNANRDLNMTIDFKFNANETLATDDVKLEIYNGTISGGTLISSQSVSGVTARAYTSDILFPGGGGNRSGQLRLQINNSLSSVEANLTLELLAGTFSFD